MEINFIQNYVFCTLNFMKIWEKAKNIGLKIFKTNLKFEGGSRWSAGPNTVSLHNCAVHNSEIFGDIRKKILVVSKIRSNRSRSALFGGLSSRTPRRAALIETDNYNFGSNSRARDSWSSCWCASNFWKLLIFNEINFDKNISTKKTFLKAN